MSFALFLPSLPLVPSCLLTFHLFLCSPSEENGGDEHSKLLAEGEEGKRGDPGDEGAVHEIGDDGEGRNTLEGWEGGKEADKTVWIHFDDFLELFRYAISGFGTSTSSLPWAVNLKTLQDMYFTGIKRVYLPCCVRSSLHILYRPEGFEYRDAMEELSVSAPVERLL